MADMVRLSPLAHCKPVVAGTASRISMDEIADRAMIGLRIRPNDTASLAMAEAELDFALPSVPRTSSRKGARQALWLSIDQWLVTAPIEERDALAERFSSRFQGRFVAAIDQSDAQAVIRLSGDGVSETLMKGSAGVHDELGKRPGAVIRTQLAGIAAMVHVVLATPAVVELYVDRSIAHYVWSWLVNASRPEAAVGLFEVQPSPPV